MSKATPNRLAGSTKHPPVLSETGEFTFTRNNLQWLIQQPAVYAACPTFKQQLLPFIEELSKLGKQLREGKCPSCNAMQMLLGVSKALEGFVQLFLWLYDHDRITELQNLRATISQLLRRPVSGLVLKYKGRASQNVMRDVRIE